MLERAPGAFHHPSFLDSAAQERLAGAIADVIARAPLFVSRMPKSGLPMSVGMTNCGPLGWMSDKDRGYRYEALHPETGAPWPPIPSMLLDAWDELTAYPKPPEACLVNVYSETAKMGLHQDRDESDFDAPILSISLGADCRFRLGGVKRADKAFAFTLSGGDALVLSGPARRSFHGVDRILPSLLAPLPGPLAGLGARLNLTLRRVTL